MPRGHINRTLLIGLLLGVALLIVSPALAQDKTLNWHRWDADIQINSDGTFDVQEVYEIEFVQGEFTFGYRNIPIDQFSHIDNVVVREGSTVYSESRSEQPNTFYVTQSGGEYVINWFYPPTRDASRTFIVEYTVFDGLIIDQEVGDRFFWKAVGPEHAFPIGSSTVTVHMPPGATVDTAIEPAIFGVEGSHRVADDLESVVYQSENIAPNREFEVGVRFPSGFVPNEKPAWQEEYEREQTWNDTYRPALNLAAAGGGALLLILGLGGVFLLWRMSGRDPNVGAVPTYLATPPSDLPPALVGTLIDEKADMQDIVATLIDLARRGAIDMQEEERKVFGLTTSKDFVYRLRSDFDEPMRGYERRLITEVFGKKDSVRLEDLRNKFYTAIPILQRELYKDVVSEGLFPSSPKAVRNRWLGIGIGVFILALGSGFCAAGALANRVEAILCPFAALGIVGAVLAVVGQAMPAKTKKGAEEAAKWEAFREYLRNAERYRDLAEVPDQFDKYLPYAIAFGLDRTWVSKFSRVPGTPVPPWYYPTGVPYDPYRRARTYPTTGGGLPDLSGASGGGRDLSKEAARPGPSLDTMSAGMFAGLSSMSSGLSTMLNNTSSVLSSVPRSSGSSGGGFSGGGFSGGGFSGGGGGGGGGGGFG